MTHYETNQGASDEWYTPKWVFDALAVEFDLDPCWPNPAIGNVVAPVTPCKKVCWDAGHLSVWSGSIWLNPPFGKRNGVSIWLDRFVAHGNGIALVPNRTATEWFQKFATHVDLLLFVRSKIKFVRADGSIGSRPAHGNVLCSIGNEMTAKLNDSAIEGLRVIRKQTPR